MSWVRDLNFWRQRVGQGHANLIHQTVASPNKTWQRVVEIVGRRYGSPGPYKIRLDYGIHPYVTDQSRLGDIDSQAIDVSLARLYDIHDGPELDIVHYPVGSNGTPVNLSVII